MFQHVTAKFHTTDNRVEIRSSLNVGCVYCLEIFEPKHITQWNGDTAICIYCNCDCLLGDKSGYPITKQFLQKMHNYWFEPMLELTAREIVDEDSIRYLNEYYLGDLGLWLEIGEELDPYTNYLIFERSREIFRTIYPKELLIKISQIFGNCSHVEILNEDISVGGEPMQQETLRITIHRC
jgi:hypothetical protein